MESDSLNEIAASCLLMRTRHLSRTVGVIYQIALDPFGVSTAQSETVRTLGRNAATVISATADRPMRESSR